MVSIPEIMAMTEVPLVRAALIIIGSIIVAKIVNFLLDRVVKHLTRKTKSTLDDIILDLVHTPIFIGILIFGVYLSLQYLPFFEGYGAELALGTGILYTFFFAYVISRVVKGVLTWYGQEMASKTKSKADDQFLPIIKKVAYAVIFGLAIVNILGNLGIEITSLIAALGIGGLAIALALQGTLSNFFAGTQFIADRQIKIGDFVEIDADTKGTIIDIGWRSTKIQTFSNNTIVVPNSTIAESTITTFNMPDQEVGFTVTCGVGYESDLDFVEKVTLEEAKKIQKMDRAVKDFEPFMRFNNFGDSNIDFNVIMRAKDRGSTFFLKHEFIKNLKRRYDKENIEIAWPVRKIHYGDQPAPAKKKKK